MSSTWVEMRCTGDRAFMARWNTTAIWVQRSSFICASESASRSLPSKSAWPLTAVCLGSCRRSRAMAMVDLPLPDSPTIPMDSPGMIVNEQSRTAWTRFLRPR